MIWNISPYIDHVLKYYSNSNQESFDCFDNWCCNIFHNAIKKIKHANSSPRNSLLAQCLKYQAWFKHTFLLGSLAFMYCFKI